MKKKLDDDSLLILILAGEKQSKIAQEFGVSVAHVCRRVNDPQFQEKLSQHRKSVLDSCMSQLTATANEAVSVLADLLHNKNGYLRFSAASRILSLVQDLSIQEDMMKEIEMLKKYQDTSISERVVG